ncbi:conserved hypothetical protein [Thermotomaculum hydrothermale]|uniref:DUF3857 domain-containing protein n=1 Tax=Thermotomaculum hydrothermale TaxID=981385 RepID=A0A7R6PYH9_9BACT|nr:DUF3857 domain-containing protein [Thermotomaculum hydrothermale]BBB31963.1 conserved hypothetical protein [Thermotomaculum hydrothermale]
MKRIGILIILFFGFTLFASQVEIVNKKIDIHVLKDGRVIEHVYEKIKINGFTGMRRAGEWFFTYNPEYTEVKVLKSVTHNSEGKVIPSPENAILDFSPYSVENAPDFSHIREKIVSHTGLEPNCVVEFEYEIRDKIPHRLVVFKDLRDRFPVKRLEVSIVDNRHCALFSNKLSLNGEGNFVVKNIVPIHTNETGEGYYEHTPYIAIIIRDPFKYMKGYLSSLDNSNFDNVIKLMGVENLSGKRFMYSVFDFVENRLNTIPLSGTTQNYKCRDFEEIVKSGYATNFEKPVLVYWLLKNRGLNPEFLISGFVFEKTLLNVQDLGVKIDGIIWPFRRGAMPFYNLDRQKVFSKTLKAKLSVNAEQDDNGFSGKYYFEGNESINFALSGLNKKSDRIVEKTNGFVVKEGEVDGKIEDKIKFSKWILNSLPVDFNYFVYYNFVEIAYPIEFIENYTIKFSKPVNAVFRSKEVRNKAGVCKIDYAVNGDVLKVKREIYLKPGFYEGKDLETLRKLLIPLASDSYNLIFLK